MNVENLERVKGEQDWKASYEKELEKLDRLRENISRLEFRQYSEGEVPAELGELKLEKINMLTDPRFASVVRKWQKEVKDPVWKRRLGLMLKETVSQRAGVDPGLIEQQSVYEQKLHGSQIEVDSKTFSFAEVQRDLASSANQKKRHRLNKSLNRLGAEYEDGFRALLHKRNELARSMEYQHFHAFKCEEEGVDFEQYVQECRRLFTGDRDFTEMVKNRFGYSVLEAGDWMYTATHFLDTGGKPFIGGNIRRFVSESLETIGVYLERIPIRLQVKPSAFQGLCIDVSPDQTEVIVNESSRHTAFATAFHEMGHALYDAFADPSVYEFRNLRSTIGHEAMAELFMTAAFQKEWLTETAGLTTEQAERVIATRKTAEKMTGMYFFYLSLVEREMYINPEQDLGRLAADLFIDVFGFEGDGFHPAVQPVFVSFPVYVHSYIYADAIRDMIRHHFGIEGMHDEAEVFSKVKEVFMVPGERLLWQEKVESLCGEPFTFEWLGKWLEAGGKAKLI
ncbi:hypothetical protein [Alteribacter natronophilus]|uniref:hypothetical protein n=1 Tax=Alteribacter natronophilus TaxID=2583810 RepID=UPI00110DB6F8|nr:hypothetical protein [Alteribacter natronophilus]TMW70743.1 hypothetical protein FGB90_16325 [Alteribacter natronophilus]